MSSVTTRRTGPRAGAGQRAAPAHPPYTPPSHDASDGRLIMNTTAPAVDARHGPWRKELYALLTLGTPMALTQLVQFSIQTIDVLMIGRLGPTPLAAAALGLVLYYAVFLVGMGPAIAISPLVSQALGADPDDFDDVRHSVRMGLWVTVLMFPLALAVFWVADDIALALGQPEELARMARPYVIALAPGLPFMVGVIVMRNFLAAIERTRSFRTAS